MKVMHICTSDINGGAARAAYRLHQAECKMGIDSNMFVQVKASDDSRVIANDRLSRFFSKVVNSFSTKVVHEVAGVDRVSPWSLNIISANNISKKIAEYHPDIVHLHWINSNYLSMNDLEKIDIPIVWTLHDTWPFTGGCHYFWKCNNYKEECRNCPQVQRRRLKNLAHWQWKVKRKAYEKKNIAVVGCSQWISKCAKESSLFKNCIHTSIGNTLDFQVYHPIDKKVARSILGLPMERQIILFGADSGTHDPRKGYDLLIKSLEELDKRVNRANNILLLVFGSNKPKDRDNFPFEVKYYGKLRDDISLALLYSSADVFAIPSREDNLPNTILEAAACGTPSIGFNTDGIPDLIRHKTNGYLAEAFDVEDYASGIVYVLCNSRQLGDEARRIASANNNEAVVAKKYVEIYRKLL